MLQTIGSSSGTASQTAVSSSPPARDLVARATDPATGAVDTRQLAAWVADAARSSPKDASAAYQQIEDQLGAGDRSRFAQDVAAAVKRDSATGFAQGVVTTGSRVLKNNPILRIEWHTTISPVTNQSGFSGPLQNLLDKHGIARRLPVHEKPSAAINNNGPSHRTSNGDAASHQLRDKFNARGLDTRLEQSTDAKGRDVPGKFTPKDGRRIDVVATHSGPNAENKVRVDAESKLGYVGADRKTIAQVEKDGARLAKNVATRELGSTVKLVGKVARPIGVVLDAAEVVGAVKADGGKFGNHTQYAVGGLAGGAAGAWAGRRRARRSAPSPGRSVRWWAGSPGPRSAGSSAAVPGRRRSTGSRASFRRTA